MSIINRERRTDTWRIGDIDSSNLPRNGRGTCYYSTLDRSYDSRETWNVEDTSK